MVIADLRAIENEGLIRLLHPTPELEYAFRHELVQDLAYNTLLKQDRKRIHGAVGEVLEALFPERLATRELAALLGRHFREAAQSERAARYFAWAGDRELEAYANLEAEEHYRAALDLLPATSTDPKYQRQQAPLFIGLGHSLMRQSRYAEAIEAWRHAIELYRLLRDFESVGRLYARSARALSYSSNNPASLQICREGLRVMEGQAPSVGLAALLHEASRAAFFNGLPAEARQWCEQALPLAEQFNDPEILAETLATYGMLPGHPPALALQTLHRAAALAETHQRLATAARAYNNLANEYEKQGQLPQARQYYYQASEFCARRGASAEELFCLSQAVDVALWLGDFVFVDQMQSRLEKLRSATKYFTAGGHVHQLTRALLLRYRGLLAEAKQHMQSYRLEMRTSQDLQHLVSASFYLGELLLELGEWAEAERTLQDILAIEPSSALWRGLSARSLLSVALVRQGRLPAAAQLLDTVRAQHNATHLWDVAYLAQAEGRYHAQQALWGEALAAYTAAAETFAQLGARWYHAQVLVEWAGVLTQRQGPGDVAYARALLREGVALFATLQVPYYMQQTQMRLEVLQAATP